MPASHAQAPAFQALLERIRSASKVDPRIRCGRGAEPSLLRKTEAALGTTLPADYATFTRLLGHLSSAEVSILGLGLQTPADMQLVRINRAERRLPSPRQMPQHLIAISPDGRGGFYCLDTSRIKHGSCPVVYRDHERLDDPRYRGETVAISFANFLTREVRAAALLPTARPAQLKDMPGAIRSLRTAIRRGMKLGCGTLGRKVSLSDIARVQRELSVSLPPPVVDFFLALSGAQLWDCPVYAVHRNASPKTCVVRRARSLWRALPRARHMFPIAVGVRGTRTQTHFCVDLRNPGLCLTGYVDDCEDDLGHTRDMEFVIRRGVPLDRWLKTAARRGFFS